MWSECCLSGCSRRSRRTGRWHRWSRTRGWWRRWSSCSYWCTEHLVSRLPAESWTETQRERESFPIVTTNYICTRHKQIRGSTLLPFIRDTMSLWSNFYISMETALHCWTCSEAGCTQAIQSKSSKGLKSVFLKNTAVTLKRQEIKAKIYLGIKQMYYLYFILFIWIHENVKTSFMDL